MATYANGTVKAPLDVSTSGAIKVSTEKGTFTFGWTGAFALPAGPPVIIDATKAVAEVKADIDTNFAAVLAAIRAIPSTGSGGGGTGGGGTVDYFPANPGDAPFPSPENSQVINLAGVISGKPYLKDSNGAIHQLVLVNGAVEYHKNGTNFAVYPGEVVGQILVRQGNVYMSLTSGIWKLVSPTGSMYNATLPPPFQTTPGGGSTGLPAIPGDPTPSAVAPGSSGRTINVTSDADMATKVRAALAGDTILVASGTYKVPVPALTVPLLFKAPSGATIDMTGVPSSALAMQKGALVPAADCIIDGFTILGAGMDAVAPNHDGTAGIRPSEGCGYVTIKNCNVHDNQNGVAGGGFPCVVTISDTTLKHNGLGIDDGGSHNIYISGGMTRLVLNNVISTQPNGGHAVKSRVPSFEWHGGSGDATDATIIDLPNGTTTKFIVENVTLTKPAGSANHGIIGYAMEAQDNGLAGGTMTGGSLVALCDSPSMQGMGGTITFSGVTKSGNPITGQGVTIVGIV